MHLLSIHSTKYNRRLFIFNFFLNLDIYIFVVDWYIGYGKLQVGALYCVINHSSFYRHIVTWPLETCDYVSFTMALQSSVYTEIISDIMLSFFSVHCIR